MVVWLIFFLDIDSSCFYLWIFFSTRFGMKNNFYLHVRVRGRHTSLFLTLTDVGSECCVSHFPGAVMKEHNQDSKRQMYQQQEADSHLDAQA